MKTTFARKVTLTVSANRRFKNIKIKIKIRFSSGEVCTVTLKLDLEHVSAERSTRTLKDADMIKLTFCWKYSGIFASYGWFWRYSLPKMAYKMSQEFPTASLVITFTCRHFCLLKPATPVKTDVKNKLTKNGNCYATTSVLIGLARIMAVRKRDTEREKEFCIWHIDDPYHTTWQ